MTGSVSGRKIIRKKDDDLTSSEVLIGGRGFSHQHGEFCLGLRLETKVYGDLLQYAYYNSGFLGLSLNDRTIPFLVILVGNSLSDIRQSSHLEYLDARLRPVSSKVSGGGVPGARRYKHRNSQ